MRLKSIASLCKARKAVTICSGGGCQYVGNGWACYLVPGKLELNKENVLTIFDIPEDKHQQQEEDAAQLRIDPETGEVEGNEDV